MLKVLLFDNVGLNVEQVEKDGDDHKLWALMFPLQKAATDTANKAVPNAVAAIEAKGKDVDMDGLDKEGWAPIHHASYHGLVANISDVSFSEMWNMFALDSLAGARTCTVACCGCLY
jgi:hypothetical protein